MSIPLSSVGNMPAFSPYYPMPPARYRNVVFQWVYFRADPEQVRFVLPGGTVCAVVGRGGVGWTRRGAESLPHSRRPRRCAQVRKLLPEIFEPAEDGWCAACGLSATWTANYGAFNESFITVKCTWNGQTGYFAPVVFLNSWGSIPAGREIYVSAAAPSASSLQPGTHTLPRLHRARRRSRPTSRWAWRSG